MFGPADGPALASLLLHLDAVDAVVGVLELPELGRYGRAPDGLGPLVEEAVDELLHLGLEHGADAQPVLEHHLPQVRDAARKALEPGRRALQPVRHPDVEHEVAVEHRHHVCRGHVLGQELRVPGLGAAVARDEHVEPLFRRDEAEARAGRRQHSQGRRSATNYSLLCASAHSRTQPLTLTPPLILCGARMLL